MIPKRPAPDLIRGGYRFSEKACPRETACSIGLRALYRKSVGGDPAERIGQAPHDPVAGARLALERTHIANVDSATADIERILLLQHAADRRDRGPLHTEQARQELLGQRDDIAV